jgi:hypothetical protein
VALQTIIPTKTRAPYNTHFNGYGLGWFVSDVKGFKQAHTGGLEGIVTQTTYIPELQLELLYLLTNNLEQHLTPLPIRLRTVTLNCLEDYVSIYVATELKQMKKTVDKTTDGQLQNKKEKLK